MLTCSCRYRKPNILNQLAKVWNGKSNTVWTKSAKTYWVLIQTFFTEEGKIIVPEKHLYEIFNYVQLYEILGEIAFFGRERKKFQSY